MLLPHSAVSSHLSPEILHPQKQYDALLSHSMPPKLSAEPLPLNELLSHLTTKHGLNMRQAVSIAGSLIKHKYNSPAKIAALTESALEELNIDDPQIRKLLAPKNKGKGKAKVCLIKSSDSLVY